jgi:hypothetical protein
VLLLHSGSTAIHLIVVQAAACAFRELHSKAAGEVKKTSGAPQTMPNAFREH